MPGDGERRPGLRAAAIAGSRFVAQIVSRHGGGMLARLKAEWCAAAGAEFAAAAWPEALRRDGALKLRVRPGLALEMQHRAPLLIERINLYFGRPVVFRLVLLQGLPAGASADPPAPAVPAPLNPADIRALDMALDRIADAELRAALAGLGRLVMLHDPAERAGGGVAVAPDDRTD